jgi:hypothetical protein
MINNDCTSSETGRIWKYKELQTMNSFRNALRSNQNGARGSGSSSTAEQKIVDGTGRDEALHVLIVRWNHRFA